LAWAIWGSMTQHTTYARLTKKFLAKKSRSIFFRDVPLLPLHDLLQYAFKQLPTTPATCWHGGGRGDLFFAELGAELGEFEDESFPRVGPFPQVAR